MLLKLLVRLVDCLTSTQQFFIYIPIALWNKLPDNIVCAKNIKTFKSRLNSVNFVTYFKGRALN